MPEEILDLIYLTSTLILLFATERCAGSSHWFDVHHPSDLLRLLSSNIQFPALCRPGSGHIILNFILTGLKHLLNPKTRQSSSKINLVMTVIIYHLNKCHGIGYCCQQYLILNSMLSQAENNLWWNLLKTSPTHSKPP